MKNTKNNFLKLDKSTLKRLISFIGISLIILAIIDMAFSKIVVNISNSHPGTIFWKSDAKPVKNDFVYFDFKHELFPKGFKVLSKKLICLEDDRLQINDQFIICNGQKYPIKRNMKTGSGKPIEQFYYEGTVPSAKAAVWGSNLESFDSRYLGLVDYYRLRTILLIW